MIFDELTATAPTADVTARDRTSPASRHLEGELSSTREQLRLTIEQYETQNEELKASNEELQAINEELRAATEELETSKEELQSINEELTTVNQELKSQIEETTRINNDLQNFIGSTHISVLFVDRTLRLMRFTPPARELFNVIGSDIGRPLARHYAPARISASSGGTSPTSSRRCGSPNGKCTGRMGAGT